MQMGAVLLPLNKVQSREGDPKRIGEVKKVLKVEMAHKFTDRYYIPCWLTKKCISKTASKRYSPNMILVAKSTSSSYAAGFITLLKGEVRV
jgi:hypothetical protein